jgi:hypothetical protein
MSNDSDFDFGETLTAKSDQLNADDLVGGPITVQITDAKRGDSPEQPLVLRLSGDHRPWKPCKTARRILAACVGSTNTGALIGRWVRLYRDPDVTWAGKAVGGIRVDGMSGIDRPVTIALALNKKAKAEHRIVPIRPPADDKPAPPADPLADLAATARQPRPDGGRPGPAGDRWRQAPAVHDGRQRPRPRRRLPADGAGPRQAGRPARQPRHRLVGRGSNVSGSTWSGGHTTRTGNP